jgi:hypothetical protein
MISLQYQRNSEENAAGKRNVSMDAIRQAQTSIIPPMSIVIVTTWFLDTARDHKYVFRLTFVLRVELELPFQQRWRARIAH